MTYETNIPRCVRRAAKALTTYGIKDYGEDTAAAVTDLIADLGHYSDRHRLDFASLVEAGLRHWNSEKERAMP